jgi:hypothetical protein
VPQGLTARTNRTGPQLPRSLNSRANLAAGWKLALAGNLLPSKSRNPATASIAALAQQHRGSPYSTGLSKNLSFLGVAWGEHNVTVRLSLEPLHPPSCRSADCQMPSQFISLLLPSGINQFHCLPQLLGYVLVCRLLLDSVIDDGRALGGPLLWSYWSV